jgi:DNA-directed RNA polymerase subunit omega
MAKTAPKQAPEETPQERQPMDSKYRMIIVAAQRSKQLQRGAHPRVEIDTQKHKHTRVALEEVRLGLVDYEILEKV